MMAHIFYSSHREGLKAKGALTVVLYKKMLRLSLNSSTSLALLTNGSNKAKETETEKNRPEEGEREEKKSSSAASEPKTKGQKEQEKESSTGSEEEESHAQASHLTTGDIVNMVSNDTSRIHWVMIYFHFIYAPFDICVLLVMLINEVGIAGMS